MLPTDGHVHSQASWDAPQGDMHATCARAVSIGLPAIAFTEHVDLTAWVLREHPVPPGYRGQADQDGRYLGDPLDVESYLGELDRCRQAFPGLRVLSGLEVSEPHWHAQQLNDLMAAVRPERVIGAVHALPDLHPLAVEGDYVEVGDGFDQRPAVDVIRTYLAEVAAMCASDAPFGVLGHIDYPLRYWPQDAGPLPWEQLTTDFMGALEVAAVSGRALEVNTRVPLAPRVVDWWRQVGGQTLVFGSDAHRPEDLARGLSAAAAMVSAHGFEPGTTAHEPWRRSLT